MRQVVRAFVGITLGLATLMLGQLAIENVAWWWAGSTDTFADPLLNAVKFGLAGAAGIAVAGMIGFGPAHRRQRRL